MKFRERVRRRLLRYLTEDANSSARISIADTLNALAGRLARHPASLHLIDGRWRVRWRQGVELYYSTKYNSVTYNYLETGSYEEAELALFQRNLRPDSIVLDIGANVGLYSLLAAQVVRTGKIIAFEPLADTLRELHENLALNQAGSRVEVVPLALAEQPGEGFITSDFHSSNFLVPSDSPNAKERIVISTLDRFASERSLPRLDFIKIDIEGSELPTLRGGIETLRRFRPMLLIELHENPADFHERAMPNYQQVLELLAGLGYQHVVVNDAGRIVEGSAFRTDPTSRSYHNYLFYQPGLHQPVLTVE